MKQILAVLLCLMLCGCTQVAPEETTIPTEPQATEVSTGMYDPDHPVEEAYPGEVRAYPLTLRKVRGVLALGNDVLTLSGQGSTTLTRFSGDELREVAAITLDFELPPQEPSLQVHEAELSFFDPLHQETVLLDAQLQEVRRIAAPTDLTGSPILSKDQKILYYCTSYAVMAWDLETGIRRTVKELFYDSQELVALQLDETIFQCRIQDGDNTKLLFLASDTGMEMHSLQADSQLSSAGSRYFAALPAGNQKLLLFGESGSGISILFPRQYPEEAYYLPQDHAAITVHPTEETTQLHYYELSTGILRSELELGSLQSPKAVVNTKGHSVYILSYDPEADCDFLYRWDVLRQPPDAANVTDYRSNYYPSETPDTQALEACREYANAIGEKYGITVRIWQEAAAIQPWDYQFEPEHLAPVLEKELKLLDQRLARYPEEILAQTTSHFSSLTISLVRQITGNTGTGSLSTATGIQFLKGSDAYVTITVGKYSEQALYHELFHVMETHILTESTALDQWESLNPAGFAYGSTQDSDIYLQGQTRAFVDSYSMGSSKEDRARVLENAMLEGRQELFRSEYMQRKLRSVCLGIREAYRLEKLAEVLPWERYLVTPLVPKT